MEGGGTTSKLIGSQPGETVIVPSDPMGSRELERTLRTIGLLFFATIVLGIRIDGRPMLSIPLAAAAVPVIVRLSRAAPTQRSKKLLGVAASAAASVAVAGALMWWSPAFGAANVVSTLATGLGMAAYAISMASWCTTLGWEHPADAYRRSARLLVLASAGLVIGLVVLLAFVQRAHTEPNPDIGMAPTSLFGRPLDGTGTVVVAIVLSIFGLVGTIHLGVAARALREGLTRTPRPDA